MVAKNRALIPAVRLFIEELNKQGFRLSKMVTERALKEAEEYRIIGNYATKCQRPSSCPTGRVNRPLEGANVNISRKSPRFVLVWSCRMD